MRIHSIWQVKRALSWEVDGKILYCRAGQHAVYMCVPWTRQKEMFVLENSIDMLIRQ